jgi:gluconokinase
VFFYAHNRPQKNEGNGNASHQILQERSNAQEEYISSCYIRWLMEYVIGLDIGTTHCKAVAVTIEGTVVQQWQTGYPTIQTLDGQSEQDPEVIFEKVIQLLHQAIQGVSREHKLVAIAFSSAMHSILAVDESGRSLTNAFTWADTRSKDIAGKMLKEGKQQLLYPAIGVPIHPMLPLCKIPWIKETLPSIFSNAKKFISIKEYVFFKLFGKYIIDHSIASASGLFDANNLTWCDLALDVAGITSSELSDPVPVDHAEHEIKSEYAQRLGLTSKISFIVGGSDGCLANIGCGAFEKGEGAITIGTSGAIRVVSNHSASDPHQRLFNYVVKKDFYVCGGPVNNGGIVIKWFAENFLDRSVGSSSDFTWFMEDASKIQAGSEGLVFLPYLLGERAPFWDAKLRGAFIGLDIRHTKVHMMRAVLEGICFGLCSVMKATEETYGKIDVLYASGGFTQSAIWLQVLCDILNKKIVIAGNADASAQGAAFIALHALQHLQGLSDAKKLVEIKEQYYPDAIKASVYKEQFEIFQSLVPPLKKPMELLQAN